MSLMEEILSTIGRALPSPDPNHLGMFIGPGAKNWDAQRAAQMQDLEHQLVRPEPAWHQTGTFRGADTKLRQEISDKDARLNYSALNPEDPLAANEMYKLWEVLDHPKLYENYPELAELFVQIKQAPGSRSGFQTRTATDSSPHIQSVGPDGEEILSTLLHEVQHAIQTIEGFSKGGSPGEFSQQGYSPFESFEQYKKLAGETEARLTESRANMNDSQRKALAPVSSRAGRIGGPSHHYFEQILKPQSPGGFANVRPKADLAEIYEELAETNKTGPYDPQTTPEEIKAVNAIVNTVLATGGLAGAYSLANYIQELLEKQEQPDPLDILNTIS